MKPFILRRTKDAVLSDLPPKILQDVHVEPSLLQRLLYQDFARSDASQQVQGALKTEGSSEATADKAPHVFQVNTCHPLFLYPFSHSECVLDRAQQAQLGTYWSNQVSPTSLVLCWSNRVSLTSLVLCNPSALCLL